MLTVPKLDELSYEQIFTRAKNMIPMMTDEWTDFNYHDPGITMLQTFAWLTDMQNYYMDATGEEHWLKYLKLLGIYPSGDRVASCLVSINTKEEKIFIPKGTKLNRNQTVYEIEETYQKPSNYVAKIINEIDHEGMDITRFAGKDKSFAEIFTLDEGIESNLYIGFKKQINDEIRFFVDVKDNGRNKASDNFSLCTLRFEYYDGNVFKEVKEVSDETCGFLKSGFITLNLGGKTKAHSYFEEDKALHYIRIVLVESEYDILPKIGEITVNCMKAYQTDTLCTTLDYVYDKKPIDIDYYISDKDLLTVYVEENGDYRVWYRFTPSDDDLCEIQNGEKSYSRKIVFTKEQPSENAKIKVTITNTDLIPYINIGETTGCGSESLTLDIDDVYDVSVALVRQDGDDVFYDFYERCDNILCQKSDDKCFQYDKESNSIVFGDNINGIQPEKGYEVYIVSLKTSFLNGGNILDGELNSFLSPEFKDLSVKNICTLRMGAKSETSEELKNLVVDKFMKTGRAVSEKDYVDIVKSTPGLIIDLVNIISPIEYKKHYKEEDKRAIVYVAVKPVSSKEKPILSDNYVKLITENLEKHRLLTSEIKVIPAKYVGIEAYGVIKIKENAFDYEEKVREALSECIDFSKVKSPFENNIIYGEIFAKLETLGCVKKVEKLMFERFGEGAEKNDKGDIIVYPDCLTYLKDIDIEFC